MGNKRYSSYLRAGKGAKKRPEGRTPLGGSGSLRGLIAPLLAIGLVIGGTPTMASAEEVPAPEAIVEPAVTEQAAAETPPPAEAPAAEQPAAEPVAEPAPAEHAPAESASAPQYEPAQAPAEPQGTAPQARTVESAAESSTAPSPSPSPSPSGSAKLTLKKNVEGGTAEPGDWDLQVSFDEGPWRTLPQDQAQTLPLGSYTFQELGDIAGYSLTDLTCDSYRYEDGVLELVSGDNLTCTFTNTYDPPRLKLIKDVDNALGGEAVATDWTLRAAFNDGTAEALPQGEWIEVIPGSFTLSEVGAIGGYTWTDLTCAGAADTSTTALNPVIDILDGESVTCTFTNTYEPDEWVDLGIVKTHGELPENGVEAGDAFTWFLEVTGNGTATAIDATVGDTIPAGLTIAGVRPPAGWAAAVSGNDISVTIPSLAPGASGVIEVAVTVDALPPAEAAAFAPPGTERPALPALPDDFVNTACVEVDGDTDPTNDCDDDTVERKAIVAVVWVSCINDAPFLMYDVATTPNLQSLPITMTWAPLTGSGVVPPSVTLSLQSGDSGRVDWPGVVFNSEGISIDWPGWRPLRASDFGPDGLPLPGLVVYGNSVADASELDQAWREPALVTFSVNPTVSYTAVYPAATPECAVPARSVGGTLAATGGGQDNGGLLAVAVLSLLGGAALFAVSRRRRTV